MSVCLRARECVRACECLCMCVCGVFVCEHAVQRLIAYYKYAKAYYKYAIWQTHIINTMQLNIL